MTMAPKTLQKAQKPDRSQEQARNPHKAHETGRTPQRNLRSKSAPPPHRTPYLNPRNNQITQTSRLATKHSQSSDCQFVSASGASLISFRASSLKHWLSRPFMPDRTEVKKLLTTITRSNTRFIRHMHWSDASLIYSLLNIRDKKVF